MPIANASAYLKEEVGRPLYTSIIATSPSSIMASSSLPRISVNGVLFSFSAVHRGPLICFSRGYIYHSRSLYYCRTSMKPFSAKHCGPSCSYHISLARYNLGRSRALFSCKSPSVSNHPCYQMFWSYKMFLD